MSKKDLKFISMCVFIATVLSVFIGGGLTDELMTPVERLAIISNVISISFIISLATTLFVVTFLSE